MSPKLAACRQGPVIRTDSTIDQVTSIIVDLRQGDDHRMGIDEWMEEADMKTSIALLAAVIAGFMTVSTERASAAVIYCQYIDYPVGCIVRPGVVLRPRPVARAVVTPGVGAPGVGVRPGTPMNRGGPVNRVGRR